jgi:phosphate-selective porin OprO/OprP
MSRRGPFLVWGFLLALAPHAIQAQQLRPPADQAPPPSWNVFDSLPKTLGKTPPAGAEDASGKTSSTEADKDKKEADGKDASEGSEKEQEKADEGTPKVKLRGRINADAIFATQSERDKVILGDFQNAVGFRRARLGAEGTILDQVGFVAEFDFAGGEIRFKDVYVAVEKLPWVRTVKVGHFIEPFSMEGDTSSNSFPFIERSSINALDPDRNWGVGFWTYTDNERATLAMAAVRSGSDEAGDDIGDGNDMAYDVRGTWLAWYDSTDTHYRVLAVGAAFSQRFPKNDLVTFKQVQSSLLQSGTDNPLNPFVKNLEIPATQNQLFNLEWATVLGPLSFQAEWNATTIDQIGGGEVFLHGMYVFATYYLTGEHREYEPKEGYFGITHVRHPFLTQHGCPWAVRGAGAWELVARFDYLNFSDPSLPPQANGLKSGDRLAEGTFGVNWYLNDYARIMFNYTRAVPVDVNFGPSSADACFLRTAVFW